MCISLRCFNESLRARCGYESLQVRQDGARAASSAMAQSASHCSASANVEHVERVTFSFMNDTFGDMPQHQQQLREWIYRCAVASLALRLDSAGNPCQRHGRLYHMWQQKDLS